MDDIVVALVRRAHGLDGEVLVELMTGDPDQVFVADRRFGVSWADGRGPGTLTLTDARKHKGGLLLRFREVSDRTAAERLQGRDLTLRPDELRELDEDEFFVHDLVGYAVETTDGEPVGAVAAAYETGSQLLLGVMDGEQEKLVPFGRQLVTKVDREARKILIDPPPGLLED